MLKILSFLGNLFEKPQTVPATPVAPQPTPPQAPTAPKTITLQEKVYITAKLFLGKHITLNDNVPHDVGCAEAVSYVLRQSGARDIPSTGFPSTFALYTWLLSHGTRAMSPSAGAIIISPTGTSRFNSPHGHVGVCGKTNGIMSNNSDSGLFTELWTQEKWNEYYSLRLGFPVMIFNLFIN